MDQKLELFNRRIQTSFPFKKKCFKLYIWCDYDIGESEFVSCSIVSESLQPRDCSSPGSSVHGILQARILEWVAKPSSRGSSAPRDRTHVSCTEADSLPSEPSDKPWGKRDAKISEKKGKKKFPGCWNIFSN